MMAVAFTTCELASWVTSSAAVNISACEQEGLERERNSLSCFKEEKEREDRRMHLTAARIGGYGMCVCVCGVWGWAQMSVVVESFNPVAFQYCFTWWGGEAVSHAHMSLTFCHGVSLSH